VRSDSPWDFSSLLHEVFSSSVSTLLLHDLPEVKLCAPSSGSDKYQSFALDLTAQICFFCALSSCYLDVKLDGPYLASLANLTTNLLLPELENFLSPLRRFSKVSKASTFASSVSSIHLDITHILGMLSLLSFVHSETSKCFTTSALLIGSLHATVLSILRLSS
jgi:hypothetical protein